MLRGSLTINYVFTVNQDKKMFCFNIAASEKFQNIEKIPEVLQRNVLIQEK